MVIFLKENELLLIKKATIDIKQSIISIIVHNELKKYHHFFQDALQGIIQILWMIAATLGASLYLGSIWALYNLPQPERLVNEESSEGYILFHIFS